jgi:hypothetical protein
LAILERRFERLAVVVSAMLACPDLAAEATEGIHEPLRRVA